jgi:flagellar biosynthetic protein FliQ
MSPETAVELVQRAISVGLMVAGPLLATALLVGLGISVLQAITQIQEQTLTFIPKLLALAVVLVLTLPWILRTLVEFLVQTLRSLSGMAV